MGYYFQNGRPSEFDPKVSRRVLSMSWHAAWLAFFLTPVTGIILLLIAFSGQGAWDSLSLHRDNRKGWFARLRTIMTCVVAASLLIALLALSATG